MSLSTLDDGVGSIEDAIANCAPEIRDGIETRRETIGDVNPSGERVLAADAFADEVLEDALTDLEAVGAYASEEREDVLEDEGPLSCCVDPLDGSKNVESANPAGTIFAVYEGEIPAQGTDLVAAGYVLYGSVTSMVVAGEDTVTRSVVEDDGSRRTVDEDLTIPEDPTVCGIGGRRTDWPGSFRACADGLKADLKTRYSGALVADVAQVLTFGGLFAYPELKDRPEGKLRQQFEGNPMAYVVESAGGRSSDGDGSILEAEAGDLHGRTPVYVGNDDLVARVEGAL